MDNLTYISVPLWQGAEMCGVDKAPKTLLDAGAGDIIARYFKVSYKQLPELTEKLTAQNKYAVLANYLREVKSAVIECFEQGSLPFTVGGDHALGLGTVAAAAEKYDDLGVIWFDAHGDMNTESTSPTGHIHGMPNAALMGLCQSELNEVATKRVKPEHIFWVGTRSLDEGEVELIKRLKLHVYTTEYIHGAGIEQVMTEIRDELQRLHIRNLHCSIDVDAIDPTIVPATGAAVANGLRAEDYILFANLLAHLPITLTSMDFVEYNPLLDDEQRHSERWCLEAINTLIRAISTK